MMNKAYYFDENGKPHDAFVIDVNSDKTATILYNKKEMRKLWNNPLDEKDSELREQKMKNWIEKKRVSPKEIDGKLITEQIIEIEIENGKKVEHIRGIKNCYKIISED